MKDCCTCIHAYRSTFSEICVSCGDDFVNYVEKVQKSRKVKRKTNADCIRSMTDNELAIFLNGTDGDFLPTGEVLTVSNGEKRWLDWLKMEV